MNKTGNADYREAFIGAVLGAAAGDATGRATEFLSMEAIRAQHGPRGVQNYALYWEREGARFAPYTDDTQMAEAVLRSLIQARNEGLGLDAAMQALSERFVAWAKAPEGGHRAPGRACLAGCHALASGVAWFEAGALDAAR